MKPDKKEILIFFGWAEYPKPFDPALWKWSDGSPFFHFTACKGRLFINPRSSLQLSVQDKWRSEHRITHFLNWKDPWDSDRANKESGSMWAVWHRAVAVNSWRAKISRGPIDTTCLV